MFGTHAFDSGIRSILRFALPTLLMLLATVPAQASPRYTITDLGANSTAKAINNAGQVVGTYTTGGVENYAFLYDQKGMHDLGSLGGNLASAWGINDAGQIVGESSLVPGTMDKYAFLYDKSGMTNLGSLGGAASTAFDINSAGQIVGNAYTPRSGYHAYVYDRTGMHDLGTFGGWNSSANAINSAGQVVGSADAADYSPRAFLYDQTGMHDLSSVIGTPSRAFDINDRGQIVGYAFEGGKLTAFLYDQSGVTELGEGAAKAINNAGQVVGDERVPAFLYDGKVRVDLNTLIDPKLGWDLNVANDINDRGQIVGAGIGSDGLQHGFLLTPNVDPAPVPEPSSWAVLAVTFLVGLKTLSGRRSGETVR